MPGSSWDALAQFKQRLMLDTFYGVAYPLAGRGFSDAEETAIRLAVANFCREQALHGKPYNPNFFDPRRDGAFYCSQLVYKAYLAQGIDLNTNQGVPAGPLAPIVFPQEIWNACQHRQPEGGIFAKFGVCGSNYPANPKFRLFLPPLSIANTGAGDQPPLSAELPVSPSTHPLCL